MMNRHVMLLFLLDAWDYRSKNLFFSLSLSQELLKDPLYIGLRHKRVRGQAYDELLDEFMKAITDRYSKPTVPLPHSTRFLPQAADGNAWRA